MMKIKLNLSICFIALSVIAAVRANEGGYEENSYDQPPSKMKFNIGFNLPSMSISLPKLELPQISIKASVKNKKPFTLKLPVIKFNGYANSEEDNSYGGGHGDNAGGYNGASGHANAGSGYNSAPSYGASSAGPTAYASGSGASGYVSASPDPYASSAPSHGAAGYAGDSRPVYSNDNAGGFTPNEPAYASSGYSTATQSASVYSGKAQQSHATGPRYTLNEEQPAYQVQNAYQAPSNVYNSRPAVNSYTGNLPATQGTGYYVASSSPVNNHQAVRSLPSYREEPKVSAPVSLYQGGSTVYQGSNPYVLSSETPQHGYTSGANNGAYVSSGSFNRRSNRPSESSNYPETYKSYETSAASHERYILAPIGDDYKWQPLHFKA